jgi:hypothetical protein
MNDEIRFFRLWELLNEYQIFYRFKRYSKYGCFPSLADFYSINLRLPTINESHSASSVIPISLLAVFAPLFSSFESF